MADPAAELRKGLLTRLKAVAGVTSLLSGGANSVYAHVPQNAVFPYVAVQNISSIPFDTKDFVGHEVNFQVHAYSREKGYETVDLIASAVHTALNRQESAITVTGFSLVLLQFAMRDSFMEAAAPPNDSYYHSIVGFSALLQES